MIDIDYIHAMDIDEVVERCFHQRKMIIDEYYGECAAAETQIRDLKMFGALTEEKEEYFEESVGDAVRKVGELILTIIEKLKDTVKDSIQFIKSKSWVNKDTDKKLALIEKRDPKAVDKLKVAINKGDLDLNSFKDLNDFFRNMEGIMDEIDKRTVDPKSIRAKIQKAKDKLDKNANTISTVAKALGIVTAAGTFYISYRNYKANSFQRDHQATIDKCTTIIERMEKENHAIREMQNRITPAEHFPQHLFALKAEVFAEIEKRATANLRKRTKLMLKIARGFDGLANRLTGTGSTSNLTTTQQLMHGLQNENSRRIRALNSTRSSTQEAMRQAHVDYTSHNPRGGRGGNNPRGGRP